MSHNQSLYWLMLLSSRFDSLEGAIRNTHITHVNNNVSHSVCLHSPGEGQCVCSLAFSPASPCPWWNQATDESINIVSFFCSGDDDKIRSSIAGCWGGVHGTGLVILPYCPYSHIYIKHNRVINALVTDEKCTMMQSNVTVRNIHLSRIYTAIKYPIRLC